MIGDFNARVGKEQFFEEDTFFTSSNVWNLWQSKDMVKKIKMV